MKVIACDTETTGTDFFHGCRPFMVLMCDGEVNIAWTGEVNPYTREVYWDSRDIAAIQEHLDNCDVLIFHNTCFDMRALESIGIKIDNLWDKIEDTLLAAHAIASGDEHGLKYCAKKYFHYWDDDESILEQAVTDARTKARAQGWDLAKHGHRHFPGMAKNSQFWKQDYWLCPKECLKYGFGDVERTFLLWEAFYVALVGDSLIEPYRVRKKLLRIVYNIASQGINFDTQIATAYIENLERKTRIIKKYIQTQLDFAVPFDWNKSSHLVITLKHLKIPIRHYTEKGNISVNKDAMKDYIESYPNKILRSLSIGLKLETEHRYIKSYFNWRADDSCIHSNLNITGTRETRQSSSAPNQQNIKGKLQRLFIPPTGYIWYEADFANIELRIWAYASGNEELISAFESDVSVHQLIMEELYPNDFRKYKENPEDKRCQYLYRGVKSGNFALIYGATEETSDRAYGFKGATARVFSRFPGIGEFTSNLISTCSKNREDYGSYSVIVLGGYRLCVPPAEPFKAANYYVQGSAGWIMTLAMIAIDSNPDYQDSGSQMIAQVHDSIKIQIPKSPQVKAICESITHSMETCAVDIFGPTPVSWKIKE